MKYLKTAGFLFTFLVFAGTAYSADILWKVYFNTTQVMTSSVSSTGEFIISPSEFSSVPSGFQLASALDGLKLQVRQPVPVNLEIRVIFHVTGDNFIKAGSVSPFINVSFESYVGGIRRTDLEYPLIMTVPERMINRAGYGVHTAVCSFFSAGNFSKSGINSSNNGSELEVTMNRQGQVVGAAGDAFGHPSSISNVQYDTWSKIKLIFR